MKIKNISKINFIVDLLMTICIIPMVTIGIIIEYLLPPGQGGSKLALWGLTRHEWGFIHWCFSASFVVLLIIHLVLHWDWIKCMTVGFFKRKKK